MAYTHEGSYIDCQPGWSCSHLLAENYEPMSDGGFLVLFFIGFCLALYFTYLLSEYAMTWAEEAKGFWHDRHRWAISGYGSQEKYLPISKWEVRLQLPVWALLTVVMVLPFAAVIGFGFMVVAEMVGFHVMATTLQLLPGMLFTYLAYGLVLVAEKPESNYVETLPEDRARAWNDWAYQRQ